MVDHAVARLLWSAAAAKSFTVGSTPQRNGEKWIAVGVESHPHRFVEEALQSSARRDLGRHPAAGRDLLDPALRLSFCVDPVAKPRFTTVLQR